MLLPSPSRDLAQFAVLEERFCRDFKCCGLSLENLHDLLHHIEESHVKVDSEFGDDDDLPFDFMDEDMDHQSGDQNEPRLGSSHESNSLSFADLAFLKAHLASLERREGASTSRKDTHSSIPPVELPATVITSPLEDLSLRNANSEIGNHFNSAMPKAATPAAMLTSFSSTTDMKPISFSNMYTSDLPPRGPPLGTYHLPSGSPKPSSHRSLNKAESSLATPNLDDGDDYDMDEASFSETPLPLLPSKAKPQADTSDNDFSGDDAEITDMPSNPTALGNFIWNARSAVTSQVATGKRTSASRSIEPTRGDSFADELSARAGGIDGPGLSGVPAFKRKGSASAALTSTGSNLLSSFSTTPALVTRKDIQKQLVPKQPNPAVSILSINASAAGDAGKASTGLRTSISPGNENEGNGHESDDGVPASANVARDGDRPYRCRVEGCSKAYKNPGGLKYHMVHGHAEDTGDPEINTIIQKPYLCPVPACEKRYKNLNGLKYHIEHAHSNLIE
ncbi:hypothetical protein HDU96_006081 [Phlyctochytrium bullatum]|nr:hypothetical protein HDU96_006081 [Phlyctochytrium bullatum]